MARIHSVGAFLFLISSVAMADAPTKPDHDRTPGKGNSAITEANYRPLLCRGPNGKKLHRTDETRPNTTYTNGVKRRQLAAWNYDDKKLSDYEEDHLISLELGGDDSSEDNLWPQPYETGSGSYSGQWGAHVKDGLENELGRRICLPATSAEHLSLAQARDAITSDWTKAYKDYVCTRTKPLTAIMKAHCD